MSENLVNIEVNGVPMQARRGQMLIEVTDREDVYIPRFCYHEKLSIAANCRMCLVEVEKAPKPLPACATPVTEGMKVFTRSKAAIAAQKATMEFLLINHPLDCPICDQGGECELQDLAMGFGRDVSRYTENKRVVKDKNLGPLISTDMTRCIHCTRCVRFGQEIAGIQELGTTGRSEHMEIGTYIERSVDHEMSGNVIDVCPVGALNSKPYRFAARAWEMIAKPLIAPHDCAGSHLYAHILRGKLKRVVPRGEESINEIWLSHRDRFSYQGIYSDDRLMTPQVKRDQEWAEVSWPEALARAAEALKHGAADEGDALGVLVSPSATLEEMHLLARITEHLGSHNIDHRLRIRDFRDQGGDPPWPWLGTDIAAIDALDGVLVVGSNLRMEVPILAHRLRRAALAGAAVGVGNPQAYAYHFPRRAYVAAPLETFAQALAGVVAAAGGRSPGLAGVAVNGAHRDAAAVLAERASAVVLLGQIALRHPRAADIRALALELCRLTGARLGYIPEGANAVGAALAGVLPHRGAGGRVREAVGRTAHAMLAAPRSVYLCFGVEPEHDFADGGLAEQAFRAADSVVCFTPYVTDTMLECANVLLPTATFAETPGTYVNAEGRWQSFEAVARPVGDAREGWRVLRVLGNELELPGCEYRSAEEVRDELKQSLGVVAADNGTHGEWEPSLDPVEIAGEIDVPIYSVDAVVRRATALQQTRTARDAEARAMPRKETA
jgi:NADH-quinone oxidoreductase subunit G